MVHVPLVGRPSALSPCNHFAVVLLDLQSKALMLGEGLKASLISAEMRNYAAILAGHLAFATPAQSVPAATADLAPVTGDDALLPPENVPQRSRPSVKRKLGKFEDGKSARRPVRCSSCCATGHTKRSCTAK